jgi:asparagine synthase (glutamine-hydrolysing)
VCGLIGSRIWDKSRFEAVRKITQETLNTLSHRGPDAMGLMFKEQYGLTLGHTRLSIFDPSPTGNQPMASQSGHCQLIYNGAIYNYVELKKNLEEKGISFRGTSDTEVLLECLNEYGAEALQKLRGMFAFAFWNEKEKTLLLARDRVGKKPLYYSHTEEGIYFASEINTLAAYIPEHLLEINPAALNDYLSWGYIGGENTIYKGIQCLPPGCYLILDSENKLKIKSYWTAQWETTESLDPENILQATEEILQEAVNIRLRADVPVGVLLSGGIDSGLVTAMAAKASSNPISTFCVGLENSDLDERAPAREIAKLYKTNHHEIILKPDVSGLFGKILFSYGQPFADPSAIPSYYVSEFASRTVKVVLNGDGGDELFCGYRRHIVARLLKYLSKGAGIFSTSTLAGLLLKVSPFPKKHRSGFSFFYRLLRILATKGKQRHLILSTDGFNEDEKNNLYKEPDYFLNTPDFMKKKLDSLSSLKNLDLLLAADFESELPYDLLVKMDIATMAHGLEARSPFLDSKLVAYSQSIRSANKIDGLQTKSILRKIARRHLPTDILNLPKRGFEIPVKEWLQGELKEHCHDLLLNPSGIVAEIFKRKQIEALLNDQKTINAKHSRWPQLIWTLFVLSGWDQKRREYRQSRKI